jgi:hypothetical protein
VPWYDWPGAALIRPVPIGSHKRRDVDFGRCADRLIPRPFHCPSRWFARRA